jgi:hypothetical protein
VVVEDEKKPLVSRFPLEPAPVSLGPDALEHWALPGEQLQAELL